VQDNSAHRLRGVPFERGAFLTDTRFTTTEPTDFQTLKADVVQARLDHIFTRTLRLNATYRWFANTALQQYHEPRGLRADRRTMDREFRDQDRQDRQHTASLNLMADLTTGPLVHQVLLGGEYYTTDSFFLTTTVPPAAIVPIDIFNPVYGRTGPSLYNLSTRLYTTTRADLTRAGVYLQDQTRLGDRWHALLALRLERFTDTNNVTTRTFTDTALTSRAGLLYKLRPDAALYASYSEGFVPQSLSTQEPGTGGPFDPEEAQSYELGAKWEPQGGRLGLGVAAYEITKTNVLQADPRPGAPTNARVALGAVRSRGAEFEINGQLTRSWNISANYAYNDVIITRDTRPANIGLGFQNAPRHQAGAFTRYNFPATKLGLGAGAEYVSTRLNSTEVGAFPAPGYLVWDAALYYELFGVNFSVRAANLFERVYSQSTFGSRNGHFPGSPRRLTLTAAYKF
jgi:iron complex outermembrane receptor protein